jgi:hypothetical protein
VISPAVLAAAAFALTAQLELPSEVPVDLSSDVDVDVADDEAPAGYATRVAPVVSVALEYDTNATRVPSGALDEDAHAASTGPPVVGDALVRAQASLAARAERPGLRLSSDVALGGKLFAQQAPKVYRGKRRLLGIATMHKSNMVPVFADNPEEAAEIAKMRRG